MPTVDYGRYVFEGDRAYAGDVAKLQCETGFDVSGGNGRITCSTDGSWSIPNSICRVSAPKCSGVPSIANGEISISSSEVGSRGKIICNTGYILIGPSDGTICTGEGQWTTTSYCQQAGKNSQSVIFQSLPFFKYLFLNF